MSEKLRPAPTPHQKTEQMAGIVEDPATFAAFDLREQVEAADATPSVIPEDNG